MLNNLALYYQTFASQLHIRPIITISTGNLPAISFLGKKFKLDFKEFYQAIQRALETYAEKCSFIPQRV